MHCVEMMRHEAKRSDREAGQLKAGIKEIIEHAMAATTNALWKWLTDSRQSQPLFCACSILFEFEIIITQKNSL